MLYIPYECHVGILHGVVENTWRLYMPDRWAYSCALRNLPLLSHTNETHKEGGGALDSAWSNTTCWNIFARELQNVLGARGLRLGHLDDRGVVQHPEKVRRLQQSIDTPTHFPVLNPEELDRLFTTMNLTDVEQRSIRAALLATAVERVLMDRLEPEAALMAANDVYEICLAIMRDEPERSLNAAVRAGTAHDSAEAPDALVTEAVHLMNDATLALHGALTAYTQQARQQYARAAEANFARAIGALDAVDALHDLEGDLQEYLMEAREGQANARALLVDEG